MTSNAMRFIYFILGWLSLGAGLLGIVLPLLPTTPFLLLAAFCFQRSSERVHRWLLQQPTLGPIIRDWNQHQVIRPRVKWISILSLWALLSYPVFFKAELHTVIKLVMILVGTSVTWFIVTRRSRPEEPREF